MSKRAAIYARVSTDLQRDNFSIPSQVADCLRYAQKQGYPIVGDMYVDPETGLDSHAGNGAIPAYVDDYTSRELSRPGLDAALRYLETVGFDVLIVHALDRLARDPYIRQTLEKELEARGARVDFVLGSYEDTPEGEVRKDLDATFAKWENAKRVERCNRGKRRKAESGFFVAGRAPFGYKLDKFAPAGLAIEGTEAELVKKIFHMFVFEGCSIRQISRILSESGVSPQLGGTSWGKSSVTKILKNTAYVGYLYYNKYKRVGNRLVEHDRNEWIRISTAVIVDQGVYEEAQKLLEENHRQKRTAPTRYYLLSGMVVCENCGRPYISQTKQAGRNRLVNDAQSYRHRVKESHCINRTISARILEPIVWDEVIGILLDPDRLRRGYYASIEQQQATVAKQKSHLESLQKGLIKLEKERQNLTALYIDPDIKMGKNEYLEQRIRIDDQIKVVVDDIESTEIELASVPVTIELESLEKFASKVREKLTSDYNPTPEDKRYILELLHIKVYLGLDGTMRLDGWFIDEDEEVQSRDCLLAQSS